MYIPRGDARGKLVSGASCKRVFGEAVRIHPGGIRVLNLVMFITLIPLYGTRHPGYFVRVHTPQNTPFERIMTTEPSLDYVYTQPAAGAPQKKE